MGKKKKMGVAATLPELSEWTLPDFLFVYLHFSVLHFRGILSGGFCPDTTPTVSRRFSDRFTARTLDFSLIDSQPDPSDAMTG